ncbi:hypothetical protein F66182_5224 [Fusarium sp. NRRL 66182]|nr:hypothetical protein F66182_5224 [Fusarium sp. NRRL 66182]
MDTLRGMLLAIVDIAAYWLVLDTYSTTKPRFLSSQECDLALDRAKKATKAKLLVRQSGEFQQNDAGAHSVVVPCYSILWLTWSQRHGDSCELNNCVAICLENCRFPTDHRAGDVSPCAGCYYRGHYHQTTSLPGSKDGAKDNRFKEPAIEGNLELGGHSFDKGSTPSEGITRVSMQPKEAKD